MPRKKSYVITSYEICLFSFSAGVNKTNCRNKRSFFNIFGFNKQNIYNIVTKFAQ